MKTIDERVQAVEDGLQRFGAAGVILAKTDDETAPWVAVFDFGRGPSGERRGIMAPGPTPEAALAALEAEVAAWAEQTGRTVH